MLKPSRPVHPGAILRKELEVRKISSIPSIDQDILDSLLAEHRKGITSEIAIALEKELGISADFWLSLQKNYDIALSLISVSAV